jgi:hypothetical protein
LIAHFLLKGLIILVNCGKVFCDIWFQGCSDLLATSMFTPVSFCWSLGLLADKIGIVTLTGGTIDLPFCEIGR